MDKKIQVRFNYDDEGTLKVDFAFYLDDAPNRRLNKKLTFFQRYKKKKFDPKMIEAYIRYLLIKKAITPELLYHQNMQHFRILIMKNIQLIDRSDVYSRNREVFRDFINAYEQKGVEGFPAPEIETLGKAKGAPPSTISEVTNPAEISKWPKDGLFAIDEENPDTGKSTLVLGASFSGKTHLLINELNKLKGDEYEAIFLFTESPSADPLKDLREDLNLIIYQGFKPSVVNFLKKVNDIVDNRYRYLIILDDVVDQKMSKTLNKMVLTFRNANIYSCILIQYPNLISKASRSSFHQVVITGSRSLEWWEVTCKIFDLKMWAKSKMANPHQITKFRNDDIFTFLKKSTKEPGVVLYIDQRKGLEPCIYRI